MLIIEEINYFTFFFHYFKQANEHLNLIISKVGYPSKEHLAEWDDYARSYVEKCTNIEVAKCFADNFPEIDRNSETGAKGT